MNADDSLDLQPFEGAQHQHDADFSPLKLDYFIFSIPRLGRPTPIVRWLVNGLIVDEQIEQTTGDLTENRLMWPSVQRSDLNSIFTCQAINTQLVEPRESSYVLDLHCKYQFHCGLDIINQKLLTFIVFIY